jgi:chemotaxis protein MotB
MAAGGGGAWKVAYADFVTAMMAFFLVMWITAQSNAIKQSIARYFQHPFDAASRSPISSKSSSGASLVPTHRDLDGSVPHGNVHGKSPRGGGMLADDQAAVDPNNIPKSGGLRRRSGVMLNDFDPSGSGAFVQFDAGGADLSDLAKQSLDALLPSLHGKLNKIEVRGHVDGASTGGGVRAEAVAARDPWQLSYQRCQAVMKYLERNGVDPKRFRLSQSGESASTPQNDPSWQLQGSRVQVYLLPEYVDDDLAARQLSTQKERAGGDESTSSDASESSPAGAQSAHGAKREDNSDEPSSAD